LASAFACGCVPADDGIDDGKPGGPEKIFCGASGIVRRGLKAENGARIENQCAPLTIARRTGLLVGADRGIHDGDCPVGAFNAAPSRLRYLPDNVLAVNGPGCGCSKIAAAIAVNFIC